MLTVDIGIISIQQKGSQLVLQCNFDCDLSFIKFPIHNGTLTKFIREHMTIHAIIFQA